MAFLGLTHSILRKSRTGVVVGQGVGPWIPPGSGKPRHSRSDRAGAFVGLQRVAWLAREALTINFHLDVTMNPEQALLPAGTRKPYINVAHPQAEPVS